MQSLSTAATGVYTVKWMFGVPEILDYMKRLDIREGGTIQVIARTLGGILVRSGNRRVLIGNEIAARIQV